MKNIIHIQKLKSILLIVMIGFFIFTVQAQSNCSNSSNKAERDLWTVHNCNKDFVQWQYKAYRMYSVDWIYWGMAEACNMNLAYAKTVNASYLLTYGLNEDLSFQWHGTIDYRRAAEAWSSVTHGQIHYLPSTSTAWLAQAQKRACAEDRTFLGCLLFDATKSTGNPATRAGDFVHEGWHHWAYKRGYGGHFNGPLLFCTQKGCDYFYWHTVKEYRFGDMHKNHHSPNQVQVEFLGDIAESSNDFVPMSVRTIAKSEANQRISSRFINAVGYRIGDPRPW